MNINLPESLEPIVRRRVEERGYESVGDYVRDLILADDAEVDRIDRLLVDAINSGPAVAADDAYWEAKKRRRSHGG